MVFCNDKKSYDLLSTKECHNPYFNRWFSAILWRVMYDIPLWVVTILILIDGFLQLSNIKWSSESSYVTILILIDGFLQ